MTMDGITRVVAKKEVSVHATLARRLELCSGFKISTINRFLEQKK